MKLKLLNYCLLLLVKSSLHFQPSQGVILGTS